MTKHKNPAKTFPDKLKMFWRPKISNFT